jgi:hypothetical protein
MMQEARAVQRFSLAVLSIVIVHGCGGQSGKDKPALASTGGEAGAGTGGASSGGAGSGGAVSGGAASGGAGASSMAAGMSGDGGSAEPPVPEGCAFVRQAYDDASCNIDFRCDGNFLGTQCLALDNGRWECWCSETDGDYAQYVLDGVTGKEACGAVHDWCESGKEPELGDPVCADELTEGPTSCALERTCTRSSRMGDEVTIASDIVSHVSCEAEEGGSFFCRCGVEPDLVGFDWGYRITEKSAGENCRIAAELCSSGGPAPVEPGTCHEPFPDPGMPGSCFTTVECSRAAGLADFVSEVRTGAGWCETSTSGGSNCHCRAEDYELHFDVPDPTTDTTQCDDALSVCSRAKEIKFLGDPECKMANQSVGLTGCEGFMNCAQSATLGEVEMIFRDDVYFGCYPQEGSADWGCSCATWARKERFDVPVSEDTWEICAAAAAACPKLVDLPITSVNDRLPSRGGRPL